MSQKTAVSTVDFLYVYFHIIGHSDSFSFWVYWALVAAHEGCFWTPEWMAVYSFWAEWLIVVWQDRLSVVAATTTWTRSWYLTYCKKIT